MHTNPDKEKMAYLVAMKAAFRIEQEGKTWEQRVHAIARMNVADKLAKAAMLEFMGGKK